MNKANESEQSHLGSSLQLREYPVTAKEAAAFLKIARSTVMALARAGEIPAHPVTNGKRKRWLFFISELAAYVRGLGVNCGGHPCAS
jgi:excisionase family DNA binding protein